MHQLLNIIVSSPSKTVGRLEQRHPFPPMYSVSGYTHTGDDLVTISVEKWTGEVFKICRLVQHELPTRFWDSGPPGSYYDSHAEKQLIAYYLSKHVILEDEVADENLETIISKLDALALAFAGAPSETTTLGSKPTERTYGVSISRSLRYSPAPESDYLGQFRSMRELPCFCEESLGVVWPYYPPKALLVRPQ